MSTDGQKSLKSARSLTITQLADEQRPPVISDVSTLAMPPAPNDDTATEMIDYLYHQRQMDIEQ